MKQIDIFGNEIDINKLIIAEQTRIAAVHKYKTMQELYGRLDGFKCKDCKHLYRNKWNRKTYFKCDLWIMSCCSATDIRLKDTACKKFESKEIKQ